MSAYGGSNQRINTLGRRANSRPDLSGYMMGGNGYQTEYSEHQYFSKGSLGGGGGGGGGGGQGFKLHRRAQMIQSQCMDALVRADQILQHEGPSQEVGRLLSMAAEGIEQMKGIAMELQANGVPNDMVRQSISETQRIMSDLQVAAGGTTARKNRGSLGWEEPSKNFLDAMAWVNQQKRLIEKAPFGEDAEAIEQQIVKHGKHHSSLQQSIEVDRARSELTHKGDKAGLHALDQEWDSLQKMSFSRTAQLRELQGIIEEISRAIMWVNEREEEELVFDWGDKNIDVYIPRKQESYSKLMSDLEVKEKDLNKLKQKVDILLKNHHPASDKIEAYMDTLQTQWSWLLQITKCIHVHLKENAAYSQFFKEASETYTKLQKEHDNIRKKFTCDKSTPLENLSELLSNLEKEKEMLMEHKRQVQTLVNKSKNIVRLKPRNPVDKLSGQVIVEALCDFKQDQKGILKGNDAILKDNSQRSKWQVTGPGGLDMLIPSVCLIVPPPNPLSIDLASKNEQYYEAIMNIWHQLFINIKSLISWQYCVKDINYINSLTLNMLSTMRPEEYRSIIKRLETHYQEFLRTSHGSEMFGEKEKQDIESQYNAAQTHYDKLVIQIPTLTTKKEVVVVKEPPPKVSVLNVSILSELNVLRQRLDAAELGLTRQLHVPLKDNSVLECSQRLLLLQGVHQDLDAVRDEYLRLREKIMHQLQGADPEQAKYLRSQLDIINQKLGSLQGFSAAYQQRLTALRALLQSLDQAEDIIKVHEARLTEKDTSSLDVNENEDYSDTLKQMKSELEQKKHVLNTMESELAKAVHWNGQIDHSFHQCDVDLSKYGDLVGQMTDRWRRIQTQIDSRVLDLEKHDKELKHYQQTSGQVTDWVDDARKRLDALQAAKFRDVQALTDHLNQHKVLHGEIKGKKEKVENVQKDVDMCASSIKNYELQLASYSAGLETLLNIPIKRTMLHSPAVVLREEAADLQSRYIELLTRSTDYHKYLGELLKNMQELKIKNTNIDYLEEQLKRLKDDLHDRTQKNQSLQESLSRYQLELNQSKDQLITIEEVKRDVTRQCNATKENLDSTSMKVRDLNDEITRLTYQIDEEKRKRKLAEERYTSQQEDYEIVIRKRQKELDELNWAKIDFEKAVKDKEREIERLKRQLDEEAAQRKAAESETSKVRAQCSQEISSLKQTYETEIHVTKTSVLKTTQQKEEDISGLRLRCEQLSGEKRDLEEELRRLQLSLSQTDEARRKAEGEAHQQRSAGTEEGRRRRELEIEIQTIVQQRTADEQRHKDALAQALKDVQEKNRHITLLTESLEEETRRRKVLEGEGHTLRQTQVELQSKNVSSLETINKLKISDQELCLVRVELEKQKSEKEQMGKYITQMQTRITDLQAVVDRVEDELETAKRGQQDELSRRKRVETELERVNVSCKEYTTTINKLRVQLEEDSASERKVEQDLRALQEALDKSLREHKATIDKMNTLTAELKALQQQLLQEQARVREANQRNESLYKTIEEKSHVLNANAIEIEKLQSMTQTLTKERIRLEEELRSVRQERDDLRKGKNASESESLTQISALQLQLRNSTKMSLEHQTLINELNKEREALRVEMSNIQKQAMETSMMIHESQTHYNEVVQERDSLLAKLKLLDQDKGKMQKLDNELSRIKVSMESELRVKQRLQDELDKMTKDFNYWKSQYDIKERQVSECSTEKDRAMRDRGSLQSQVEQLKLELRSLEERYKSKLQISEKEILELNQRREALEREIRKLQQRPEAFCQQTQTDEKVMMVDPDKLLFDGVRRKVSAHQLCDCGIINKATLDKLLKGEKTVSEVAIDIQLNLKGTGVIAGMVQGTQGRMPFAEAKGRNLLSNESAMMLLEAQAATGHILDPKFNEKMSVDAACSRGVVDTDDRDVLITAEAASTGFKDPFSGKLLSVGQACKKGHVDKETTLRLLQAQESVGGILDPTLSVYLPKDAALDRNLIDDELYRALNKKPPCYLDPDTQQKISYTDLKKKCRMEPATGLLLIPAKDKPMTVKGLREEVAITDLVDANLLDQSDLTKLNQGTLTSQDIEDKLKSYLHGSDCIAGIYDEANDRVLSFYQAMKEGLLRRGTTLELLEAQAASGFMIDPVNNKTLTVNEAHKRGLVGKEYKDKLLSAERAVTGYKDPHTGKIISLFQAIEKELIEKGHGIRLLEAQIASGGIIDPIHSHRIEVDMAYKKGYFDRDMNEILSYDGDDTKGFFDPNTHENLTYLQLKDRCMKDPKTGLILLPLVDKKKAKQQQSSQKNTLRKRRVVIVDPDTGKEMTVREAYHRELIDYETFLELSEQECEWEEITITASDGSVRLVIVDRKTGTQYDVQESLNQGVINQATFDRYRSGALTLTQFADMLTKDAQSSGLMLVSSSAEDVVTCSSPTQLTPSSPTIRKRFASVSITLSPPAEMFDDQSPVAAIFDTETLEKITIPEAQRRGIIDNITAQRLLEAQACTGGVINPATGQRLILQDAVQQGILDEDMASKLKPAQKAYFGFEDVKTKRKMSAAEAMKEKWLPYEAGQRFMEFQYLTGGLIEPTAGQRVTIEEAIRRGWLDGRSAQKLQDSKSYQKMLTCPKTKLKISYKDAMDNCMVEENMGMKMLQASSMSTKGISSPYNVSSGPSSRSGSRAGSRTGSRSGSRRGSVDYSTAFSYNFSSSSKTFSSGSMS
ncbi:desmoplakin-A isoform X1 [Sardina pilchardus]|uniref:desmoplakin-A isoform X1 n=1 Tax=Sardina pilchardus TaxID=27697 RepID=UPI002E12B9C4